VQHNLGSLLKTQGKLAEAIAAYREATRLNPKFGRAYTSLGVALKEDGKLSEAIVAYRKAIRLTPDSAAAHNNFGLALQADRRVNEAIAEYREAIRLQPDLAPAHINLGALFSDVNHDYDAAIAEYREAIRLQPNEPAGHVNLALVQKHQGKFDDAIAACAAALRIDPRSAVAYTVLGTTLLAVDRNDEAAAACREAVRLNPNLLEAQINLGFALRAEGKLDEALVIMRNAVALAPAGSPIRSDLLAAIHRIERQQQLQSRLPGVLKGDDRPSGADELVTFAQLCCDRQRYAVAVRLWSDAFERDTKLASDRSEQHRYNAASAAILATTDRAKDDPVPDEMQRTRFRQQALLWLQAERAAWAALLESNPADSAPAIVEAVQNWKTTRDLADVRAPHALENLPTAEQQSWREFWADADALIGKALGVLRNHAH
jgi:tetratricopeptide (TPR) repeat protein